MFCRLQGFIEPGEQKSLLVRFIPAVPEKFNKSFLVQVAHFQPENVNLYGEGVFPRISLDLPRVLDDAYESLAKEASENVERETKKVHRSMSAASQQRAQPYSGENMLTVRVHNCIIASVRSFVKTSPSPRTITFSLL